MALIVFTGGARCGKSSRAQDLAMKRAAQTGQEVTVAVFGNAAGDSEFAEQIRENKSARPESFKTLEAYGDSDWLDRVPADDILVIDCLGTVLSSVTERFESSYTELSDSVGGADSVRVTRAFNDELDHIVEREGDTVIITNQVGDGLVPGFDSARLFRNQLGLANDRIVDAADAAYYVVCGRLVDLTSLPRSADWPED